MLTSVEAVEARMDMTISELSMINRVSVFGSVASLAFGVGSLYLSAKHGVESDSTMLASLGSSLSALGVGYTAFERSLANQRLVGFSKKSAGMKDLC